MGAIADQVLRENGKDPNLTIQDSSIRLNTHTNNPKVDYAPLFWVIGATIVFGLLVTIVILLINLNRKTTASK